MRLEKKMATLLAAILIAMMGVMPALAAVSDTTTLTVTVPEILSISVDTATLNFPTYTFNEESEQQSIIVTTISNAASPPATVNIELTLGSTDGSEAWYNVYDGEVPVVMDTPTEFDLGATTFGVTVTVPDNVLGDSYSATLTFVVSAA